MLPSLLHMGFDNHYNCVDEHDYNQRMQILLPLIESVSCCKPLQICAFILQGMEITLHRCIVVDILLIMFSVSHLPTGIRKMLLTLL